MPEVRERCPAWAPPLLAVQFLTRLPVPGTASLSPTVVHVGLGRAVAWFPLVGALVGAITAGIALAGHQLWPAFVAVPLALALEARLTGAFHEDAVADFCDAFGGGHAPDDVRRIMKDSRIGSYGALGLVLALLLRAALMIALLSSLPPVAAGVAIIASATFGRLLAVGVMTVVPPAASPGLARDVAANVGWPTLMFACVTALPGLLAYGLAAPTRLAITVALAAVFVAWFRRLLLRRIGGSTGDCLGFAAYVGQLLLLLAAAAR
ncbi:adenosylcobinamide-GDP ribazoletransferase [Glacieibacterium sp.]|uniref:adenosylcobinamide-GDP ribazoletransferase n=1 Tax=Glacieibacterium sp. TaxID=2860237 RepID=UPI003B00E0B1